MKLKLPIALIVLAVAVLGLAACGDSATPTPVLEPRELTVLVGDGRDNEAIMAFLPTRIKVRVGDSVTWKINSDDIHTASFLSGGPNPEFAIPIPGGGPGDLMLNPQVAFPTRFPGAPVETYSGAGVVNSGVLSEQPAGPDAPPNDTFTLIFDTPGEYQLVCLVHPFMRGMVEVKPTGSTDVSSQAGIDAQAQKQLAPLKAEMEQIKQWSPFAVTQEPGAGGTTIWNVQAGTRGVSRFTEFLDFVDKEITI